MTPSINIEQNSSEGLIYLPTPNARNVIGEIVNSFNAGFHSFNIIGSYGTGKSSFILALEKDLKTGSNLIIKNNGQFNGCKEFEFIKIVGDYAPMMRVVGEKFENTDFVDSKNFFEIFKNEYQKRAKKGVFLFIMIDEFGKILEHAAKNNPESELYFLQMFSEFVNNPKNNIILITTLHQNFSSYAKKLSQEQKNEWTKVKGRFKEIVFNEPVEQLLYLAAKSLESNFKTMKNKGFEQLYEIAIKSKCIASSISKETAFQLYPMDLLAANALTLSIQRYGQNERTLFTFLEAKGQNSFSNFKDAAYRTFSIADVYDYDIYNFYTYLSEVNSDSTNWTAIRVALERVESCIEVENIPSAFRLVKSIGMLNLFGPAGTIINKEILCKYAKYALDIDNAEILIDRLIQFKIIRYAIYRSQYILFEGTDIDIEGEILKASSIVPKSRDFIGKLKANFNFKIDLAISTMYKRGTPRYFECVISDSPISTIPVDETDGYLNLVFDESKGALDKVFQASKICSEAILYVYFRNTNEAINHIWQIDKLDYILNSVIVDKSDKVAIRELENLMNFEKGLLNKAVSDALFNFMEDVVWIYKGEEIIINNNADYNRMLSQISDDVYKDTPILINELVNKHKTSGVISLARTNYLQALLEHSDEKFLGFKADKFPPEKTIYMSLLYNTGIHHQLEGVLYELSEPKEESFLPLWRLCEEFFISSTDRPRKLGELIKQLRMKPFKLKQGLIDFWLPTYLIIKKNDYSLYDSNGTYVPFINKETLEILQKSPSEFSIKAFKVDGVKLDLFNKYREAVSLKIEDGFSADSLIETIRPFIVFYKKLNNYAKHTKKFDNVQTLRFRDIIAKAKDPEKTFFEDLPKALGFKETSLSENNEILLRYVELIQNAIRDLRGCYSSLIDRIENAVIKALNLKSSIYIEYKIEIEKRYGVVKVQLLTSKQKTFLDRLISPMHDKIAWYQSISYVILDKQLESLLDEEEEYLIDGIVYLFNELTKYIEISNGGFDKSEIFYRFELISNSGELKPQMYSLSEKKVLKSKELEQKLNSILTGDDDIIICTLLNMLKNRMTNE